MKIISVAVVGERQVKQYIDSIVHPVDRLKTGWKQSNKVISNYALKKVNMSISIDSNIALLEIYSEDAERNFMYNKKFTEDLSMAVRNWRQSGFHSTEDNLTNCGIGL